MLPEGTKSGRPFGRPKIDKKTEEAIRRTLNKKDRPGVRKIAADLGVGVGQWCVYWKAAERQIGGSNGYR